MAITTAAASNLRAMLAGFRAAHSSLAVPTGQGKALEAWVLMRLALAARAVGWTVSLRRGDDTPLAPGASFVFPANGSPLKPASATAPMFVLIEHAQIGAFELHGSLTWKGRSAATHECDVSMIPRDVAMALRARRRPGYPRGLPLVIVECKDKVSNATLDEMRQMLARMFDLALVTRPSVGACRIYQGAARPTLWGRHGSQYRALYRRGLFVVARSSDFQSGARTLADHYSIAAIDNVYSARRIAEIERRFQRMLGDVRTF